MNLNGRTADHPIDLLFLERWSPRAFVPEPMPPEVLLTTLEPARGSAACAETGLRSSVQPRVSPRKCYARLQSCSLLLSG